MNDQIINDMKKLGLNEYEIKAYLSLLEDYPVNGYVLSKNSKIPRSRIYEVLENLKNKQLVFEEKQEKSSVFSPIEPELLVKKFKKNLNEVLENVESFTKKIYNTDQKKETLIQIIRGRENILDFSKLMIEKAEKRIALFVWEEEIDILKDSINIALEKGVIIRGLYFGNNNPYKELVTHRRIERYLEEKKERSMIVVSDSLEVISGVISKQENSQATFTKDHGFIEMSEEYILHDLVLNLHAYNLKAESKLNFEDFSDRVRQDYFNYSEEEFNKLYKL